MHQILGSIRRTFPSNKFLNFKIRTFIDQSKKLKLSSIRDTKMHQILGLLNGSNMVLWIVIQYVESGFYHKNVIRLTKLAVKTVTCHITFVQSQQIIKKERRGTKNGQRALIYLHEQSAFVTVLVELANS